MTNWFAARALLFDELEKKYDALEAWFNTPQGLRVAAAFFAELSPCRNFLHGSKLLQLGSCGNNVWLSSLRYRYKWLVSPCDTPAKKTIKASLSSLPVDRDSIDCVVAPLTIEGAYDNNLLDEIDRVLKPMGYAVFFGVNPISFWGLALRYHFVSCFGSESVNLTSSFSIKNAMLHRGYKQCVFSSFFYIPPCSNTWLKHLEFFNTMGKMIWPWPAGFYCLIMQKYNEAHPNVITEPVKKFAFHLTPSFQPAVNNVASTEPRP